MRWSSSPTTPLGIALGLAVLAATTWLSADWSSGGNYDVAGTILILPLLVAAWVLALRRRERAAARLAAAAGTIAAMLAAYAYQYSGTGYAHWSATAPTASIASAILFAMTTVISLVVAPKRLDADGSLVMETAIVVVALLVVTFVLLIIVICGVLGQCPGSG